MEAYLCRWRFMVNLEYDWFMMMSLGGAVVSFYHVNSREFMIYKMIPSVRVSDFG